MGSDSLGIDDVKLGTNAELTDIGLRDSAVIGIRQLDIFRRAVEAQEEAMKAEYYDPDQMPAVREALRQAGVTRNLDNVLFTRRFDVEEPLFGAAGSGSRLFQNTLREVEASIATLRKTGILRQDTYDRLVAGMNAWHVQMRFARDEMKRRLPFVAGIVAIDDKLLTTRDQAERQRLYERRRQLEDQDRPISDAIRGLGKPLPFTQLRDS
jgi:hypothetical protein